MINKRKWKHLAEELHGVQLRRKFYEEEESRLKQQLSELSGDVSVEIDEWSFTKVERKGAIGYSSIPFLKAMDLEEFRRPGTIAWLLKKSIVISDL